MSYGFPIILKAAAGGGGRGMRRCDTVEEVKTAYELVHREAEKAFGCGDIFMEKYLIEPKHVEVQILADQYGNVYHLGERDCSLQRRYQKVVEFAPAWSAPQKTVEALRRDAVKIAKSVGYVSAGTVEFLVDKNGDYYFIEMNPRIQVEHTVTEMVTGIDIVRAQILIAAGHPLSDPIIGLTCQEDVKMDGYAIQCRVTTEDPANNFAPITARSRPTPPLAASACVSMAATPTSAPSSPLLRLSARQGHQLGRTFAAACRKSARAINEVRVRGVKTNIPFVTNILAHPAFINGQCHTKFIDETPELFDITDSRDRATRVLKYIAEIQVAAPNAERHQYDIPPLPRGEAAARPRPEADARREGARGREAVGARPEEAPADRYNDARRASEPAVHPYAYARHGQGCRRRGRYPARLLLPRDVGRRDVRRGLPLPARVPVGAPASAARKIPNIPFQMLLRGSNLVGYSNYPDNLVRAFVQEAAERGIDVFRVFDSLNWIPSMEVAMDEVLKQNKLLEATMCYTGDILDPTKDKYTLEYYVNLAKELEARRAHAGHQDMSGLLKPYAAKKLVATLKQEVGLPIHLHTHDTTGNQVAALLMAAEAGVDVVDVASATMSGLTSQPSLDAVVAALQRSERDTGFDLQRVQELSNYWSDVRLRYESFDHGLKSTTTDIYRYEIPGGQYTNLHPQVDLSASATASRMSRRCTRLSTTCSATPSR